MPATAPILQSVRTAITPQTIWSEVSEDDFRRHLVALEELTNAVPVDVLEADGSGIDLSQDHEGFLPVRLEKQIADDIAFITAVTEGAQSVAAVCLEQHVGDLDSFLVVMIAGMDVVDENVKGMLKSITHLLTRMVRHDVGSNGLPSNTTTDEIFELVIQQHKQKLLGRLRSRKWTKPKYLSLSHKKSLWQDFDNVIHRAQHVYPKRSERKQREAMEMRLTSMRSVLEEFETAPDEQIDERLRLLVRATYDFCRSSEIGILVLKLEQVRATSQIAAAIKTLHQLEKIGAYWRIAKTLVDTAGDYPQVFRAIELYYLTPFASTPTTIAYESWAKTCHVHAEIQLLVDSTLRAPENESEKVTVQRPRTIGTSKYLCFLCHLFLHLYSGFILLNTHGRLYDQWTVPDLEAYNEPTRRKFAETLKQMDEHVRKQTEGTKAPVWRAEPMTSRQNLFDLKNESVTCEEVEQPASTAISPTHRFPLLSASPHDP